MGDQTLGLSLDYGHIAAQFDLGSRLTSLSFFWSTSDQRFASSRELEVSVWVGLEGQSRCPSQAGLGYKLWGPLDPGMPSH